MKTKLSILSVFVGAISYLYMVIMTASGTGEGLSLSTFALWSMLAWITSFTMYKQGANPAIPMIYATGSTTTTIILLLKGRCGWTSFDTVIAILFVLSVIQLMVSGPRRALILSVFASCVAAMPFLWITWQNPMSSPVIPNSGFLLANILSFASAGGWTLEDRLYSGMNIVLCALLVLPWLLI